jgi:hypothetical protein
MQTPYNLLDAATSLDVLAIACCFVLIVFLLLNRRKYGRFVISALDGKSSKRFANQVSLHMVSQQSKEAYNNLQQALTREFASLHNMGAVQFPHVTDDMHSHLSRSSETGGPERRRRYRIAEEMLARGDDARQIVLSCSIMEGEVELLRSLQQFEEKRVTAHQSASQAPVIA